MHDAEAVDQPRQHEGDEAQQVFRHDQEDVGRHHRIGDAHRQEDLRDAEARAQHGTGDDAAGDHEQRVQDVVGRDDAGPVRWLRAQLDQGVHRHAVEAREQRQQRQIGQHAPVGGQGQEGVHGVGRGLGQAGGCEIEVDREHAHADGADRHQPDLDVALGHDLAQQRADADADREHRQQQRGHLRVAVQHLLREGGEVAQEHGAEEPHP
mmetsp:Transcript_3271/g.5940  ORF Transcript_3271/g.5940 Transcript_3271/m.5940 type:complete len:209 (+) Transcript_3271:731-1357(+)